jgi:hypothetical protein
MNAPFASIIQRLREIVLVHVLTINFIKFIRVFRTRVKSPMILALALNNCNASSALATLIHRINALQINISDEFICGTRKMNGWARSTDFLKRKLVRTFERRYEGCFESFLPFYQSLL